MSDLLAENTTHADESFAYDPITDTYLVGKLRHTVLGSSSGTPPVSPTSGDEYLVPGSGATGAWTGYENHIAVWRVDAWVMLPPNNAFRVRDVELSRWYVYDEVAGAWGVEPGASGGAAFETTFTEGSLDGGRSITFTHNLDRKPAPVAIADSDENASFPPYRYVDSDGNASRNHVTVYFGDWDTLSGTYSISIG